jgi:acyl-coenzyme A thioesterase PaaI-like protein
VSDGGGSGPPGAFFEGLVERIREGVEAETSPSRRASRRLGDAMRAVIEGLAATTAPPDVLARAAAELEDLAEELEAHPKARDYDGFAESANAGDPSAFFEWSPLLGRSNPLAPPVSIEVVDGLVVGLVRFGVAYEGPPGCVHGGYIAAAFDEVLGLAQSLSGQQGMTASLTVDYRRPTPLNVELRVVGELLGISGRRITTRGELWAGEVLTAEARALFVSFDAAKFSQMINERRRRLHPG